jgi:hypothetical protein
MVGWKVIGLQRVNGFLRDKYYVPMFMLNVMLYDM